MRILFNTDQIYLHGGIEKVMATKANYFASLPGFDVIILTTEQNHNNACYYLDERIKQIDVGINYDRTKSYFSATNLKKVFTHYFRQKKMFKKLQPDIVISANYNFDHYWLPFIVPTKTKVIKEIHASGYLSPQLRKNGIFVNRLKWKLNDYILSKYDTVVVLNEDEKNYQMSNNVVVIPNPIDIPNVRATLENKQVIAAGRIAPVKGFDQLVDAWRLVHQKQPEWQLHIYGDGYADVKEKLQLKISENKLEKTVFFKNSVNNLSQTMLEYSIYAMSSITECFPMVLLEAQSVGLPIVSYDCPNGPRHIVHNNNDGLLVENQNPEAFAEGILSIMRNEDIRKKMGSTAKLNSINFETSAVLKQWILLFRKLNKN